MALHPGPWLTAPPQVTAGINGAVRNNYGTIDNPDFTAACEPSVPPDVLTPGSTMAISHLFDGVLDTYGLEQLAVDFVPLLTLNALVWTPTLPSRAVGWEYDPVGSVSPDQWVTGISAALTLDDLGDAGTGTSVAVTVDMLPIAPTDLTYFTSGSNADLPMRQPVPGAALGSNVGTATLAPGTSTAAITTSEVAPTYIHNLPLPNGPTTAVRFVVFYANQHSHIPPGANSGRVVQVRDFPTLTVYWTPPRYRFLYAELPPLRQYPRDDNLGGAPRQGTTNGATSVQGSARQGWRATYR